MVYECTVTWYMLTHLTIFLVGYRLIDDIEHIGAALRAEEGAALRLVAGGLGPTSDDLTTEAVAAASEIGFPVVLKLAGDAIAHKTERGLVRVGVADAEAVRREAEDLLSRANKL